MRVLVSGAGIAGLSLALRLKQRGLTPVVVERSPRLRVGGCMLGLSDPGLDAAERMGVADALRAARHLPRRLVYIGPTGREHFAIDGPAIDRLIGERQFNLLRGDVERVLFERMRGEAEVRFGASVEAVQHARGGVGARLSDGEEIGCDLVVGADGLHSKVRASRFGPGERFVRSLGARAAAFLLDRSAFLDLEPAASYSLTEVGRAAALAPVGEDRLVAFFIWRTEGRRRLGTAEEELRAAFAGAGWHVLSLLDLLRTAHDVYFDEVAQVVMPRWSDGRTVLLGDAAHAVSLIAGKGARHSRCPVPSCSPTRWRTMRAASRTLAPATKHGSGPGWRPRSGWPGATSTCSRPRTASNSSPAEPCCASRRGHPPPRS